MRRLCGLILTAALAVSAAGSPTGASAGAASACPAGESAAADTQTGLASWYVPRSLSTRTASGETPARQAFTAAHRTLPLGTVVRVTNLENCRTITVVVNDRGPYARRHRRILDVSKPAARALGIGRKGVVLVRLERHTGPIHVAKVVQ